MQLVTQLASYALPIPLEKGKNGNDWSYIVGEKKDKTNELSIVGEAERKERISQNQKDT